MGKGYWDGSGDIVRDTFFPRRYPTCGFCGHGSHRMDTCPGAIKADEFAQARIREGRTWQNMLAAFNARKGRR